MQFNYAKEKAKFERDWAEEKELLQSENASEELIEKIHQLFWEEFNSDRKYYRHNVNFEMTDTLGQEVDFDANLEIMQQINNSELIQALDCVKEIDRKIFFMSIVEEYTHEEIAKIMNCSRSNITHKLNKVKKYLKSKNIF